MKSKKTVIQLTHKTLNISQDSFICTSDNLKDLGLDSLSFVTLIVELEAAFNIKFDDEKMLMTEFLTINNVIEYVDFKVGREANKDA